MLSVGRFSSVLFPAFIWCATVIPVRQRGGWLASFMAVQAFNATLSTPGESCFSPAILLPHPAAGQVTTVYIMCE